MPFTLTMPKLSPTMEEGTIIKWHKRVGDQVNPNDVLFEVATDKATVEYNALDGGWLRKIIVDEGSDAIVNEPVAIFSETKDENIDSYKTEGASASPEPTIAPTKAPEKTAPETPVSSKSSAIQQPSFVPEAPLENYQFPSQEREIGERVISSPLARRIAEEKNIDLSNVKGSGPRGRIMSKDLEGVPESGATFGNREIPKEKPGSYEEEKLTPMRKSIARRLQESKSYIPHFYVTLAINVEPLVVVREQLKSNKIAVSYNDLVVKACSLALREHSVINSGFNSVNNSVIKFKTIDISVAASISGGLITPIIRHADFKNLGQISAEIRSLVKRAKDGKLSENEYKGGSFTVSNLGMYGVTEFQAIINPPQAAILAVGGILEVPVVRNGQVVPGKIMNLTLSVDHRVIDGVAAAEFLNTLKNILENPVCLLLT